ncbi:NAD(P)H-flavin reductase [Ahniella affigens]|uniref:NAD(P)H-flavin reductase n=1 Tax=Ahniella affigens TaxID=2021234 RepID=A0A2P1PXM7_9GAMM|nr:2Fe-2S iron-sulfur cluster-binding protein [Ahniella affigens]AVP99564.1 NAD(P)H-flavin reductase [Ahniella affigens]
MPYQIRIEPSGHQFQCDADTHLLDAARAQGFALPYSCRSGVCGSCQARLVSGQVRYASAPPALRDGDTQAILLCQAFAKTDLVISAREVPSVADMPRRITAVKVIDKQQLASDVMLLRLQPPRGQALRSLAGQYLEIMLPEGKRRAFSIANAPEYELDDHAIELHVRRVAGGGFTERVFTELPIGSVLRIEAPLGTFVPREDSDRPMLFMAGGTGFAPIKAIIEHFLALGSKRPMRFFWGARTLADLYLDALPKRWASENPHFSYVPVLSEPDLSDQPIVSGPVHEAVLAHCPDLAQHDLYMSGPPGMIDVARHAFSARGLPEDRMYYDSFEYAPEVIAAILAARAGVKTR